MSPAVWGPIVWSTMHIVSLGYSDQPTQEESDSAIRFYESLQHMIPCPICKEHYRVFLEQMPVRNAVQSRQTLIRWVFTIHNHVNEQLGKPQKTFQEYIQHMSSLSHLHTLSIPHKEYSNTVLGGVFLVGMLIGSVSVAYAFSHTSK